ncbi:MAG: hypothetical protein U1U88_000734 [Lawsonella clevelandensis]
MISSWWEGPDIFLIVDDYDLVATSSGNPLLGLLELLPYGRDIGLHMVVARRCTGFSRTSFEPIMSRIRELHPTVFVMNRFSRRRAPLPVAQGPFTACGPCRRD